MGLILTGKCDIIDKLIEDNTQIYVRIETNNQKEELKAEVIKICEEKIEIVIYELLKEIGVSMNNHGYYYITDAVTKIYFDNLLSLTNDIYPAIAKKYKTKAKNVEKIIRTTIESTFNRINSSEIVEYFGNTLSMDRDRPTNLEFITAISIKLRKRIVDID